MRIFTILLIFVSTFFFSGCSDDGGLMTAEEYITANKLSPLQTPEGVYYIINEAGGSEKPNFTSVVTVHYTGKLTNGEVFDSSVGKSPLKISLLSVVPGWKYGIPKFGKGGKGTLIIPSELGYGEMGVNGSIPPNAALIFDIELIDFKN